MSKRQWLMVLGVWVMVFLFLGFPSGWNWIFALVSGALIVLLAYRLGDVSMDSGENEHVPYVESKNHSPSAPVAPNMSPEKPVSRAEVMNDVITSADIQQSQ